MSTRVGSSGRALVATHRAQRTATRAIAGEEVRRVCVMAARSVVRSHDALSCPDRDGVVKGQPLPTGRRLFGERSRRQLLAIAGHRRGVRSGVATSLPESDSSDRSCLTWHNTYAERRSGVRTAVLDLRRHRAFPQGRRLRRLGAACPHSSIMLGRGLT